MDWRGRKVAVVGLGRENVPLVRYLAGRGARITALDRKEPAHLPAAAQALAGLGVRLGGGPAYLEALTREDFDAVFLTPGMAKNGPEIQAARRRGAVITSQTNLFLERCRAPVVGITGSSGKSTTTTLIGRILAADGRRPVYVGGNIGRVLIEQVDAIEPESWVVLELSSFQLELVDRSPHVAVFLNLRPNHLDVHGSMAAYEAAKRRIFEFQRPEAGDVAVLGYDDPAVRAMAAAAPAGVTFFGTGEGLPQGATLRDEQVGLVDAAAWRPVLGVDEVALPGRHNLLNVLAAVAAAAACGAAPEAMRAGVAGFSGLEHRLQPVGEIGGRRFVNDSIATAPDRAAAALAAFEEPVVWIAGGYDKGIAFDALAEEALQRPLRAVVLTGATAGRIGVALEAAAERTALPLPPIHRAPTFDEAVDLAARLAQPGDVVLLSPACASYDAFTDFAERGRRFAALVEAMAPAKGS
ncbi:MAG TPA: UDP-N-acetylmuramoyl-L-alanine--D-glutamate ligase [Bacillota bacterium]